MMFYCPGCGAPIDSRDDFGSTDGVTNTYEYDCERCEAHYHVQVTVGPGTEK